MNSHPWSFSGSSVLLTGFTATVSAATLRLDPGEIAQARWFSWADLRELRPAEARQGSAAWIARTVTGGSVRQHL
jgi:NADH pyrophosphatase NudC (nudix superfamily)